MKKKGVTAAVFSGGSAPNNDHITLAEDVGLVLAKNNYNVVNGGGSGLMEAVAKSAYMAGAYVIGIHFDFEGRKVSEYNSETIRFSNLLERQKKVFELGDVYVFLPGGLGTLYELIEAVSLKYVNVLDKPIILVNDTYWKPFISLIDSLISSGYAKPNIKDLFWIADSSEQLETFLKTYEKK